MWIENCGLKIEAWRYLTFILDNTVTREVRPAKVDDVWLYLHFTFTSILSDKTYFSTSDGVFVRSHYKGDILYLLNSNILPSCTLKSVARSITHIFR